MPYRVVGLVVGPKGKYPFLFIILVSVVSAPTTKHPAVEHT